MAFLVAVVAIIQGMNAYVKENVADAMIGSNTFQVRRTPINIGLIDDENWRRMQRRPKITHADAEVVRAAIPDAEAISITSGWPTPQSDVVWRNRTLGDVLIFGVSPDVPGRPGLPLLERASRSTRSTSRQRRNVVVIGADVAKKLFEEVDPIGREVRIRGELFTVVGVVAAKGRVLGQSFDGFVMMPITTFESMYGRRHTTTISVKMPTALEVADAR